MSEIVVKNYVEYGLDKLLQQFKDKEKVVALLTAYLQSLEDTKESLITYANSNNIDDATGVLLDVIGEIVGEKRLGKSDLSYRKAIKNKVVINTSEGTPNQLLEILELLTNNTKMVMYEHFPFLNNYYSNADQMDISIPQTLLSGSPVTTEGVGLYHDPEENAWIPSELSGVGGILVNDDNLDIITDEGKNILINYLAALGEVNIERAILPDIGETTDIRIPCDVYQV